MAGRPLRVHGLHRRRRHGPRPDPDRRARSTVAGDSLHIDFTGTSPQVRGAINATGSFAKSAAYACVRAMMSAGIPNNGGYFRPISFTIPSRSVINPDLPAPVAARGLTGFRLTNAIMGALAKVAPDRVPACESGGDTGITIAGWYDDDRRVRLPGVPARLLGRPAGQGRHRRLLQHQRQLLEQPDRVPGGRPPAADRGVRVRAGHRRPGQVSGAGSAMVRQYRFLEREGVAAAPDRPPEVPAVGPGGRQARARPRRTWSSSTACRRCRRRRRPASSIAATSLRHTLAGAGGHGDPLERDPALVAEDVADEKVSLEAARSEYGVVIDPATLRGRRGHGRPPLRSPTGREPGCAEPRGFQVKR